MSELAILEVLILMGLFFFIYGVCLYAIMKIKFFILQKKDGIDINVGITGSTPYTIIDKPNKQILFISTLRTRRIKFSDIQSKKELGKLFLYIKLKNQDVISWKKSDTTIKRTFAHFINKMNSFVLVHVGTASTSLCIKPVKGEAPEIIYKTKNLKGKSRIAQIIIFLLFSIYIVYIFMFSPGGIQQRSMSRGRKEISKVRAILNKDINIQFSTCTANSGKLIFARGTTDSEENLIKIKKIIKDKMSDDFKIIFRIEINKK